MKKLGIVLFLVIAALALLPATADAHSGCSSVSQLRTGTISFQFKYYCYQVKAGPWYAPWQTTTTRTYRAETVPYLSHIEQRSTDGCSIPERVDQIPGIKFDFPASYRTELRNRFEAACNQHDWCYSNTRSYITKSRCDREFLYNMYFICNHIIASVPGCYHEASVMYSAVALADAAQKSYDDRR